MEKRGDRMRLTKKQKEMIRTIASGEVWDILSYVKAFQQTQSARYDWNLVQQSFSQDPEAGCCYCPKNLKPTPANRMREDVFLEKQARGQVKAEDYICLKPQLEKTLDKQIETVGDREFSFDLYVGVEMMESFDQLVEFLAIWQFLRERALVLEVPQPLDGETAGLFFQRQPRGTVPDPDGDKAQGALRCSDRRYLTDGEYHLSQERLTICGEFLGRRVYPAPGLKLFIQNRFRSWDEAAQSRALWAAWAAVAVSILIALAPYLSAFLTEALSPDKSGDTQTARSSAVGEGRQQAAHGGAANPLIDQIILDNLELDNI